MVYHDGVQLGTSGAGIGRVTWPPVANKQRLGRPRDADSAQTRARILHGARQLFAARGYEATSNRMIAEEAGLTTGAIYHYFDRKLDIFTAVHREAQDHVYARFEKATVECTSFLDRLEAVLETAHDLNNEDPSIARFLGSCRVDAARDAVIASALREHGGNPHASFWSDLIEFGVQTGEIGPDQKPMVNAVIQTITTGLVDCRVRRPSSASSGGRRAAATPQGRSHRRAGARQRPARRPLLE